MMLDLREDQARELELLLEYHTRELLQQIDHAKARLAAAQQRHAAAQMRAARLENALLDLLDAMGDQEVTPGE